MWGTGLWRSEDGRAQPQVTMSLRQLGKAFARHLAGSRLLTPERLERWYRGGWGVWPPKRGRGAGGCHCQLLSEFGYNYQLVTTDFWIPNTWTTPSQLATPESWDVCLAISLPTFEVMFFIVIYNLLLNYRNQIYTTGNLIRNHTLLVSSTSSIHIFLALIFSHLNGKAG